LDLAPYIAAAEEKLQKTEQAMATFDFTAAGADHDAYGELNREYQRLSRLVKLGKEFQQAARQLGESQEMLEGEEDAEFLEVIRNDIETLQAQTDKLERQIKTMILPPHPNEQRNTIIEIRPAAGGDEAGLFAADLFRMYSRFAEEQGWRLELLELAENDVGGIRSVAFSLQGEEVYRYMQYESGVHRVQRIPVTESGGRIHTSTVTVAVLPEAEDVDIQINSEDLRVDVYRSSGPGGQSVNTTDSAVRVTHVPTGVTVSSQQEKSQHRNREIAMRILRSRLLEARQQEEAAKSAAVRKQQVGSGERSERIRTYNFPQNRVSDHRFGITRYDLDSVVEGQIGELLEEIIAIDVEQRLSAGIE
jgi:peptide chain release factor 1